MYRITAPTCREIQVDLPTSKSITHRALILSGLNLGTAEILKPLLADDTEITISALNNMGSQLHKRADSIGCSQPIGKIRKNKIFLGNSGSSARFLIPLAALVDKPVSFYGEPRLHQRPFAELFSALRQLGLRLESTGQTLPVKVFPAPIRGGRLTFKRLPSSQIISALMMAAPWMQEDLQLLLPVRTPSLPYITMTHKLMRRLGFSVQFRDREITVTSCKPNCDWSLRVEKDLSAASYWVLLAMINRLKVILTGVDLPSLQGDVRIFEIAAEMGSQVMLFTDRIEIEGDIRKGLTLDCRETPDLVPALAVLALFAPAPSRLLQIEHLEYKESNRITALQQNISVLGGKSMYRGGNLIIYPQKKYHGGIIHTYNDHRIAMSFAVAGTRISDIRIDRPECVSKSYPDFWRDFNFFQPEIQDAR
jgi:3-phosphoshikimate 1-carboxyvinyltransferase